MPHLKGSLQERARRCVRMGITPNDRSYIVIGTLNKSAKYYSQNRVRDYMGPFLVLARRRKYKNVNFLQQYHLKGPGDVSRPPHHAVAVAFHS
jgi:hypothetical protein